MKAQAFAFAWEHFVYRLLNKAVYGDCDVTCFLSP